MRVSVCVWRLAAAMYTFPKPAQFPSRFQCYSKSGKLFRHGVAALTNLSLHLALSHTAPLCMEILSPPPPPPQSTPSPSSAAGKWVPRSFPEDAKKKGREGEPWGRDFVRHVRTVSVWGAISASFLLHIVLVVPLWPWSLIEGFCAPAMVLFASWQSWCFCGSGASYMAVWGSIFFNGASFIVLVPVLWFSCFLDSPGASIMLLLLLIW